MVLLNTQIATTNTVKEQAIVVKEQNKSLKTQLELWIFKNLFNHKEDITIIEDALHFSVSL